MAILTNEMQGTSWRPPLILFYSRHTNDRHTLTYTKTRSTVTPKST